MQKHRNKKQILIQSVLASTLFVAPHMANAATIVNQQITPSTPLMTSAAIGGDGTIIITQTGQVAPSVVTSAVIQLDSMGGVVNFLEGNHYFAATTLGGALVPNTSGIPLEVTGNGSQGQVNIAPVVSIDNQGDGSNTIQVDSGNTLVQINNAGLLTTSDPSTNTNFGSSVFVDGDTTTLFNDITGSIINSNNAGGNGAPTVFVTRTNFSLNNLGSILNPDSGHTSNIANALSITLAGTTFNTISNSGFIQQTNNSNNAPNLTTQSHTVLLDAPQASLTTGDFINNPTGVISMLDPFGNADTIHITKNGVMGDLINFGVIENLTTDNGGSNPFGAAIHIAGSLESLQNNGRIYSTENNSLIPTILADSSAVILNGFTNTGEVINGIIGNVAADFSAMPNLSITNSGSFVGAVLLAPEGNNGSTPGSLLPIFTMTDGTLAGRLIGNANANNNVYNIEGGILVSIENAGGSGGTSATPNVYNLSGGQIADYVHLPIYTGSGNVSENTVNLSGTAVGTILGSIRDDIFNITGSEGSFFKLDGGGRSIHGDTLNVQTTFTTNGQILNMDFINVQNAGTVFTTDQVISGIRNGNQLAFIIDSGTTFTSDKIVRPAPGFQATVSNNGTLAVPDQTWFDFSNDSTTFTSDVITEAGGLVVVGTEGVLRISGNNDGSTNAGNGTLYINSGPANGLPGGIFNTQIFGPWCDTVQYGVMNVDSFDSTQDQVIVNLESGSFIQPQFTGFLPNGTVMNIINVYTGGFADLNSNPTSINDESNIIPYPSALVYFTKQNVLLPINYPYPPSTGNDQETSAIQLTSHRNSFSSMSSTGVTPGVAQTLDAFAAGCPPTHDIYVLLSQFDQIPTQQGVEAAMESLIPGFNYGLIAGSHIGMDSAFEAITDRVFELSWNGRHHQLKFPNRNALQQAAFRGDQNVQLASNGTSFGDGDNPIGVWGRVIGAYLDQGTREGVAGYHAKGAGFAIGADWGLNDCTTYGVELSYTRVNVDDKNWAPKDEHIKSWQGTLYGFYDFCYGIYLDAMVGYAHNRYNTNRVIHVNNLLTAAKASFNGNQWGLQGDLGMAIPNDDCYFFAPFVRLKYVRLNLDSYSESGAGDFNLNVNFNEKPSEFLGGVGFRVAKDFAINGVEWVPELMAMVGYDFHNSGEQTGATFFGAGPAFGTNGVIPGKTMFDLGLALNAVCGSSVFTAKYNLELRSEFVGNAGYLQYYYTWS